MTKDKKIKIKKINKLDLPEIERRIAKLSGQEESLYYQHLESMKYELEKD
jgi:FKBP-type peptidyl-prolyl cis-trans isomerase (trigger factor)